MSLRDEAGSPGAWASPVPSADGHSSILDVRLSEAGEAGLIELLRKRFGNPAGNVIRGIGDDAAVLGRAEGDLLITTDMMVEGVHFDLSWTMPYQLGFKLVTVNVSDIYAMGGHPAHLLLDFAAPKEASLALFERLYDGIEQGLREYGLSLVGGDISSSDRLTLSATVLGYAPRPLFRSGARVGDEIYVTGPLGDAACGLEIARKMGRPVALEAGEHRDIPPGWDVVAPLLKRHLMPLARKPDSFITSATAMMDVSDGLLIDLFRLCTESGVGAVIHEELVPRSPELLKGAGYLGLNALDLALSGGEDYELLFTASPAADVAAIRIGEVTDSGFFLIDREGKKREVTAKGYQHFADL